MNDVLRMAPERLLQETQWLRALASTLAGAADADDLCQETWLSALEQPRNRIRGLRPWLRTVLHNRFQRSRESGAARTRRELAACSVEEAPSMADLAARASVHRAVVDAVLELDEPHRSTVLLRFFDDRKPGEIARLQGVPVETVRSRLRRALAILRARLDRELGSRETWMLVAVPGLLSRTVPQASGVGAPLAAASLLAGVLTMSVKAKLIVAAGILLLLAGGVGITWDWRPAEITSPSPAVVAETTSDARSSLTSAAEIRPIVPTRFVEPDGVDSQSISGRVVTVEGYGIADATMTLVLVDGPPNDRTKDPPVAKTDASGDFRLPAPDRWTCAVIARARGFQARVTEAVLAGSSGVIVTLVPSLSLAGRLVAVGGTPIPNGTIRWLGATTLGESWITTTTDPEGRFQLQDLPILIDLVATAPGWGRKVLQVWPESSPNPLTIELSESVRLHGRVTAHATGLPIAQARVELWDRRPSRSRVEGIEPQCERLAATASNENGEFVIEGAPGPEKVEASDPAAPELGLWTTAEGLAPKWNPLPRSRDALVSPLEVRLMPAASVTGRVLDGSGAPKPWCPVEITTRQGNPLVGEVSLQNRTSTIGTADYYAGRSRVGDWRCLFETQLVAQTDEDGRYTFIGLPVTETVTARVSFVEHEINDTNVAVELSPDKRSEAPDLVVPAVVGAFSGRVTDEKGAPLARVLVTLGVRTTSTDAAGSIRFEMRLDAQATGVPIRASLRGYQPLMREVDWAMIDSRTVTLVLEEGFDYCGVVTDAAGSPLAKAFVMAVRGTRPPERAFEIVNGNMNYEDIVARASTSTTGAFRFQDLPPLCHFIALYPEMRGPFRATAMTVAPRLDLRFQLDVGEGPIKRSGVTVRAEDEGGAPILSRFRCVLQRRGVAVREVSSGGPVVTFLDLPLIDYELVATADGYAEVRKNIDLHSGTREIQITFGTRELRGRLVSSQGVVKRGAIGVRALSGGIVAKAVSEDDGTFVVRGLAPGAYLVAAEPMLEPNLASDGSPVSEHPSRIQIAKAPSQEITLEVVKAQLLCVNLRLASLATTRPVYGSIRSRTTDFAREARVLITDPSGTTWFDGPPGGFGTNGVAAKVYVPAHLHYGVEVFQQGRLVAQKTGVPTSGGCEITIDDATPGPR